MTRAVGYAHDMAELYNLRDDPQEMKSLTLLGEFIKDKVVEERK